MSSSNDVFGDFSKFFQQLGSLNSAEQVDDFFRVYWYAWLIIAIGVVLLIVVNVLICCYFRHHKNLNSVDPKTRDKRLYDKDWGITKPTQTIFIPVEQNKQEGVANPLMVEEYDDDKFTIEALMAHNKYRFQHGSQPLQMNDYLCRAAKEWATRMATLNELKHSPDHWRRYQGAILGENLAFFMGPVLKGDRITDMWYREVKKHDFKADIQPDSLHFSQMIWKSTKEVGFGRCQTADKRHW